MSQNKRWYAVYTAAKAEKKVGTRLQQQGIEHYLPLQKICRQWSDRKKWVEEPLFRSYIFVYTDESQYFQVLNTHGVVKFITFGGKAVPIPDFQIALVKRLLMESIELELTREELIEGMPVEITAGPLMGTLGELVYIQGEKRVAIKIHTLETSMLVNIPDICIETIRDSHKLALLDSMRSTKFAPYTRELG
ncbi:MAG: UpxY family transcription antiterminator [Bacteroidetes bacterium]|nr:UpxY family transcription antiterminator [Bacteroidota bacterium]